MPQVTLLLIPLTLVGSISASAIFTNDNVELLKKNLPKAFTMKANDESFTGTLNGDDAIAIDTTDKNTVRQLYVDDEFEWSLTSKGAVYKVNVKVLVTAVRYRGSLGPVKPYSNERHVDRFKETETFPSAIPYTVTLIHHKLVNALHAEATENAGDGKVWEAGDMEQVTQRKTRVIRILNLIVGGDAKDALGWTDDKAREELKALAKTKQSAQ